MPEIPLNLVYLLHLVALHQFILSEGKHLFRKKIQYHNHSRFPIINTTTSIPIESSIIYYSMVKNQGCILIYIKHVIYFRNNGHNNNHIFSKMV